MPGKPKVIVFSSKKTLLSKLENLKRARLFDYASGDPKDLANRLDDSSGMTLAYLDASQFSETEIRKLIASRAESVRFGVVDNTGAVSDPATLLHQGAVDYIGKALLQSGLTGKRIAGAIDYCDFGKDNPVDLPPVQNSWKLSGNDWKGVRSGQEYTFCFMFVEIDLIDEWKKKSGQTHLDEVKAIFQKHMQEFSEALSGRIWMWMDHGGLILFPFDGERCTPILPAIRMVLSRTIISAERYRYDTLINYRIAIHIGNTVYKSRGNTATIVSDAVNFLFHLGHQFAQPGNFYLTAPAFRFMPEGFDDCFVFAGDFEDTEVWRMRLPLR